MTAEIKLTTTTQHMRHGSTIGQPLTRRDGELKVTGAARFAADNHPKGMVYAVMVGSKIARGRVTSFNIEAAKGHPGVIEVITPANRPPLAMDPDAKLNPFMFRKELLQNDTVRYANQPIAVVIGETLEAATEGAVLLAPTYEAEQPRLGLDVAGSFAPSVVGPGMPAAASRGEIDTNFSSAAYRIEETYETPRQYHNAMEPHAIVVEWMSQDRLSIDMPSQALTLGRMAIAGMFGLPPENVEIRSPFVGGGFGSKGIAIGPMMLGVLAARIVGRPVKLVFRRDQMYGPVGHRAPTRQTLRIGVKADGAISALAHHAKTATSSFDDFVEPAANATLAVYASDAVAISHEAVRNDTGTPLFMRAPGLAPSSIALESAIDEAAWACRMDPLAFRLKNYADVEPISGRPFSSKALRECYAQAAERFGWAKRSLEPRQTRDENGFLVGWGVGTAIFPAHMFEAEARAVIRRDGTGVLETGAIDMGQGAWTAFAQIAADSIALDLDKTTFRSGATGLPDGGVAGGSAHTATVGVAIHNAGASVIGKLADLAMRDERSPLFGGGNAGVVARSGRLHRQDDETKSESYAEILRRADLAEIDGHGRGAADAAAHDAYAMYAHGAVFAEVKVDPDLGQVRVSRMVGAFAAGRIINPRLVLSQYHGGMIWGASFALHEQAIMDHRSGRTLNADLAEYRIPVMADVPSIEAMIVDETDRHVNALGIKGVGETSIVGSAGAIANAVWHATGVRVRRFPIRIEDLL